MITNQAACDRALATTHHFGQRSHVMTCLMRRHSMWIAALLGVVLAGAALIWWQRQPPPQPPGLSEAARLARYETPLPPPESGLRVFHLGHSLVSTEMPAFTQQLAEAAGFTGADYRSQLGWGASLMDHWDPARPVAGFDEMNATVAFKPATEALESGLFDAFVFTEMVDLQDAIRWHQSGHHAGLWAALARRHRADIRIFLYETWHGTHIADGWLERLDADLPALWEGTILAQAKAMPDVGTIHLIPAGQVMAAFTRALEAEGGLPGLADRHGLFRQLDDGTVDEIHLNDLGQYLVALVHFATLYQTDPRGLPHALKRADGTAADAPSPEVAALMQQVVWDVVRALPQTGIAP